MAKNKTEIYLIDWDDIKSFEPFQLKRKYGKRKRTVYKLKTNGKKESTRKEKTA